MRALTSAIGLMLLGLLACGALLTWQPPHQQISLNTTVVASASGRCETIALTNYDGAAPGVNAAHLDAALGGKAPQVSLRTERGALTLRIYQIYVEPGEQFAVVHTQALAAGDALPAVMQGRPVNISVRIKPTNEDGRLSARITGVRIGRLAVPTAWFVATLSKVDWTPELSSVITINIEDKKIVADFSALPSSPFAVEELVRIEQGWGVRVCRL